MRTSRTRTTRPTRIVVAGVVASLLGGLLAVGVAPAAQAAPAAPVQTALVAPMAIRTATAPVSRWVEDFENVSGTNAAQLGTYSSNAYTADPFWLTYTQCNGVLAEYDTTDTNLAAMCTASGDGSRNNIRRLADTLGQFRLGVTGATTMAATTPAAGTTANSRANRALTAWTENAGGTAGQTLVVGRSNTAPSLGISATTSRYYTLSLDMGEASCGWGTNPGSRAQITLGLNVGSNTGSPSSTSRVITPCTDTASRWYTSTDLTGGWANGGNRVAVGRFTSDTSLLLTGTQAAQLRPVVRNNNVSSGGNDLAVDNLRVYDATPTLDMNFASGTAAIGATTQLTYTITNTTELAEKRDWAFTNTLPAGLVLANTDVTTTCGDGTLQQDAASGVVNFTGGDLAANTASCTVTVNVTSDTTGTYANQPAAVTTTGLNAPESTTLVVQPTLTVQKDLPSGRALTGDQFTLRITQGATQVATATTTGTASGVQSAQASATVTPGQTYTIAEAVSASPGINRYAAQYTCQRDGVTIATGTSTSGDLTIPTAAGGNIVCVFSNSPQSAASLYCDASYFYSIRSTGSLAQVNVSAPSSNVLEIVPAQSGIDNANALGIAGDGKTAYGVQRGDTTGQVEAVLKYAVQSNGSITPTRVTPSTAYTLNSRRMTGSGTPAAIAANIVGGAVSPVIAGDALSGDYILSALKAGSTGQPAGMYLWAYDESGAASGTVRFDFLGYIAITGASTSTNGDIGFDNQGNLMVLTSLNGVAQFSTVRRADLLAGAATTSTTTNALAATMNEPSDGAVLQNVNGMAFSSRGSVYLGNGSSASQYNPMTWTATSGPYTISGTGNANSTDLASCASPSTVSLDKRVVGRAATTDNFQISLANSNGDTVATAQTGAGNAAGTLNNTASLGPFPAVVNSTLTIGETATAGNITAYNTKYECWANGALIASGTARSAQITIPNQLSVGVACTYFNTSQPIANVTITKTVQDAAGFNPQPGVGWTMGLTSSTPAATVLPSQVQTQQTDAAGSTAWQVLLPTAAAQATLAVSETQQTDFEFVSAQCVLTRGATTTTTTFTAATGGNVTGVRSGDTVNCAFVNKIKATTLTLVQTVASGTEPASTWNLAATGGAGTLAGPSGKTGTPAVTNVQVSPAQSYALASTNGPARYISTGWTCVDQNSAPVTVTSSAVTLPLGTKAVCTATAATSNITILKNVVDSSANFSAPLWTVVATPTTPLAGLATESRAGAEYAAGANAAQTFEARPGYGYTLSERLTDTSSSLAYLQVRLEKLNADGTTWSTVASPSVTAPTAGQSAVYRWVNSRVPAKVLPFTGGSAADLYLLAGGAVVMIALALALGHSWRRSRRSRPI